MKRLYRFRMTETSNEFVSKVSAIKGLRQLTSMELKEAKVLVEDIQLAQTPIEMHIDVYTTDSSATKEAINLMAAGGVEAIAVNKLTDLLESVKQSALLAVQGDEIDVAIRLLEIIKQNRQ